MLKMKVRFLNYFVPNQQRVYPQIITLFGWKEKQQ